MQRGGLRAKIISWFLIPTMIILITVALVTFYAYEQLTAELVTERNAELTELLAEQLATALVDYAVPLRNFVATHPYIFEQDLAARQTLLRQALGQLVVFDSVLLLDEMGRVVAADRQPINVLGQDWSDRPFVQRMLEEPGPQFSNIESDVSFGAESIDALVVTVPATDPAGQTVGMMAGMFRLDPGRSPFYRTLLKLQLYSDGNLDQGRAIYHSDIQLLGQEIPLKVGVKQVMSGRQGALHTLNSDGQEIVASFAPVPGTPWRLVIEESWATLTQASQSYRQLLLILLALGIAVPALVVTIGMRRITHPLARLSRAAQQLAGGDLSQTIQVHTGDELEELAGQFNLMSAQLRESYATLEQRVADRTKELATLNAISAVVSRSLDLEEIMQNALDEISGMMGMEAGGAFRLQHQVLTLIAHRGLSREFVQQAAQLPLVASAAGQAADQEQPVVRLTPDYPAGELKTLLQQEQLEQVISIPLIAKGRLLGAINLATRRPRQVTREELSLLAAVGQQTGVAVENAHLYEQAEAHAVAAERSRLARDLHDAVTQTLFSTSLIAEVLPRLWERNPEEGRRRLNELQELTRGALAEMRTLLLELRPKALEEAQLGTLMRQLSASVTGRARIPVHVEIQGRCALPFEVKVALYRIAQEALNNVVKHAGATQATLNLQCTTAPFDEPDAELDVLEDVLDIEETCRAVELCVSDDGRGFDPGSIPPDHLGVSIMRERAVSIGAELELESEPGAGTRITVRWEK
jgi:nitrate/nitrite-specific signal transduction histidine kinase